jgi:hypothetical protein
VRANDGGVVSFGERGGFFFYFVFVFVSSGRKGREKDDDATSVGGKPRLMRESTIYLVGLSRPGESSVFASRRANDRANDRGARRKKFQRAFASRARVRPRGVGGFVGVAARRSSSFASGFRSGERHSSTSVGNNAKMKTFEITFRLSMKNIQSAFDTQFDFSRGPLILQRCTY